jgi:hypothetical protein
VTRAHGGVVLVVVTVATFAAAALSAARSPTPTAAIDSRDFVVIVPPGGGSIGPPAPSSERISDFLEPPRWIGARPVPSLPAPRAAVIGGWVPKPPPIVVGRQHRVLGRATWFCRPGYSSCTSGYPGGLYAAAGSELRIGRWRGRHVNVCSGSRCVVVQLIDWCACGGSRVIDLYSDAFRQIGSLSQGTLAVTVRW